MTSESICLNMYIFLPLVDWDILNTLLLDLIYKAWNSVDSSDRMISLHRWTQNLGVFSLLALDVADYFGPGSALGGLPTTEPDLRL